MRVKNLFLTGTPRVGKTTIIRVCTKPFSDLAGGFYTEEIRENHQRMGFVLKTFDGQEKILAYKGKETPIKVGKYGVDLEVLENVGVAALEKGLQEKKIIVIDEVGKMETFSEKFVLKVIECLNSDKYVIGTFRYKAKLFSEEIKKFPETKILVLTRENYREVKHSVKLWLNSIFHPQQIKI